MIHKGSGTPANIRHANEVRIRGKIGKLLKESQGILRGTLSERTRSCGKPSCKCANGEKHPALYLVQSKDGKLKQLFIPADWADDARQWVSNYQVLQQLLDEISDSWWDNIRNREL